jgi:LPXTG-site transpeptidase (sortase) family protein
VDRRRSIEVCLWVAGLSLLAAYGAVRAWSGYASHQGIVAMREARAIHAAESREPLDLNMRAALVTQAAQPRAIAPDMTTWSNARRAAYRESAIDPFAPRAVLRIPSLSLEVPIYEGTSAAVLNRGAGLIEGTALPGADGNIGIAAHRDGFFRPLQRIGAGADLFIDTVQGTRRYRVTDVRVVEPRNVAVLAETVRPTVTLVTCYPFYFVGAAPQRFIVRAEMAH